MNEELSLDGLITQLRKVRSEHPGLADAPVIATTCALCPPDSRLIVDVGTDTFNGFPVVNLRRWRDETPQ